MRLQVAVGSTNRVKIEAVQIAFEQLWPENEWEVIGVPAASGVADQPMSDRESIMGARNRAQSALAALDAAYGVGLEGGLQQIDEWWFDSGWVVVIDRNGHEGIGSSAKIAAPPLMMKLVGQGMEIGEVVDVIFQQKNSKQADGHFGLMTRNAITRRKAYADGVLTALARFLHPDVFVTAR